MIYTMTLNPALDYHMTLQTFEEGKVNRSLQESFMAGGKGLMVSQMLHNLSVESTALGLIAGFTGEELARQIHSAGIKTNFVTLPKGLTRINVKLWGGIEGEINTKGPECDEKSLQALLQKLSVLSSEDILVLAGTIPQSLPPDLYARIMLLLKDRGTRIVVDATGDLLKKVVPYKPFLIKPNHHELSEVFSVDLKTKEDVVPYALRLKDEGAQNVLVSLSKEGAVLVAEDRSVWFGEAPKGEVKNTVGSGDSMVAGFLYTTIRQKKQKPEEALLSGLAAGSASAFSEGLGSFSLFKELLLKGKVYRA